MSVTKIPKYMSGVVLTGHGGPEKLEYRTDLEVPAPKAGEVLIRVGASAVNNTDINTRIGWYSKGVTSETGAAAEQGFDSANDDDASWSGVPLQLPRIQGADCCGEVIAVGEQVAPSRIGERVMVRTLQAPFKDGNAHDCITFGSECDGGFAQYAIARSSEAFAVESVLSDAELASFPCAYSTAENMIDRVNIQAGELVLITGASGGVGSAAIQLVKRRKAKVIAVCGADKMEQVSELGADQVISRGKNLLQVLGADAVDVVIDLVAGDQWPQLPDLLRRGGRYTVAGAIGGPMVEMDVRTLYLKDLSFFGCTYQPRHVFENLVSYIEGDELKPLVSAQYALQDITQAQQAFMEKKFIGKLILLPPGDK